MATKPKPLRNRELGAIHAAKKQLGLDDDAYRALLEEWTGKRSAAALTSEERRRVIQNFRHAGFARKDGHIQVAADDTPQIKMIKGQWLKLHRLGEVKSPTEASLDKFVARQVKSSALRFTNAGQRSRVIEALKGWIERVEGG